MTHSVKPTGTILDRIVADKLAAHRKRYAHPGPPLHREFPVRDMVAALCAEEPPGFAIIAEIKRASPSKGLLREDFEPIKIARAYAAGGARAISVLTEEKYFQGSMEYLRQVRAAVALPLLGKDFILHPRQVDEAYAAGADALLLIVRILERSLLTELYEKIQSLGLTALLEVHDAADLEVALQLEPRLIGINNRDLRTFTTSLETTLELLPLVPKDVTVVSESGLNSARDLAQLKEAGAHAFLVGEALMRHDDPGARLTELRLGQD